MEQYEISPRRLKGDLLYCLRTFPQLRLYVRETSGFGGREIINEALQNNLNIIRGPEGLLLFTSEDRPFQFKQSPLKFSIAYERFPDQRTGIIPALATSINPDDTKLPDVNMSFFRSANYQYLVEIYFRGKIPLRFHSWHDKKAGWKNWCVDR